MFQAFAGKSDKVEAEYGSRAEEAYTIAEAVDFDVYAVRGFTSRKALIKALAEYDRNEIQVEIL